MLWLITAAGGLWGWAICKFAWKVEGQDHNAWYQGQLKQALFIGAAGWVGYPVCGLGWLVHAGLGVLGFMAINKGQDYQAPVIGGIAAKTEIPDVGGAGATPSSAPPPAQDSPPEPEPEPEIDAEGDSDWVRDYQLEAVDDSASFDLRRDLSAWFRAERHIEASWEDRSQRRMALARHGIRDEPHYFQVKATVERFVAGAEARQIYGGPMQIQQLMVDAAMDDAKAQHQQNMQAEPSLLEPVEGVALEHWAWAQAHIAQGHDAAQIIGQLQIDQARWERVSAAWNDRMSRDTSQVITTEYGKYFSGAGAGQFAEAGQQAAASMTTQGAEPAGLEPIPFERWVEISVAMDVGADKGWDPVQLLGNFSMSAADWGMASAWWSQKFQVHAHDQAMLDRYNQLQQYYQAHYSGGS